MLLDTIKRHDPKGTIRIVSIDRLRVEGKPIPPQIHSVPALMILPSKEMIFGKQVFDYLLLPGSGKLLAPAPTQPNDASPNDTTDPDQPSAFSLGMGNDAFALIEGEGAFSDRGYAWTPIEENPNTGVDPLLLQEESRTKKSLPDMDSIMQQRELDLRGEINLNVNQLNIPTSTRL